MNDFSKHIIIILPSLILANVLHMLIVKYNLMPFSNKALSFKYLGGNKTWRGLILVPILNSIFLMIFNNLLNLQIPNAASLGLILGLAYVAFELPNSYLKRKRGIKPGETSANKNYFFMILDKTDSALGVALVYFLLGHINLSGAVLLLLINSGTHIVISFFLVSLKIKSSF